MAINFQLLDKSGEAISLNKLDEDICKEILNVTPHERYYGGVGPGSFNWFDSIGYQLASGKTLEDGNNSVREHYENSDMWQEELSIINKIINYLQKRYTAKNWSSWGRR